MVIDGSTLFIGTFNLDPRSLYLNTEMGMMVESSELAESMATSILVSLPESSYRLRLSERGKLQWVLQTTDVEEVITTEPQSGTWLRLRTWLLGLLPIEEQM